MAGPRFKNHLKWLFSHFMQVPGTAQSIRKRPRTSLCSFSGTVLWSQQTVRLSCWSSMFNGIRPEPTNKPFNSAYLQIKFLICRKIHSNTFWLDETFLVDHKSPWCFREKDFLKTKKSEWDFQLGTLRQAHHVKIKVALEKSLRLHTRRGPAAAAEAV